MKFKLLLLAILLNQFCIAQTNFTISKSEAFLQKQSMPEMFFGCIGDNLYFVEDITGTDQDNLAMLDKDMKKVVSEPLITDNADKQIIKPLVLYNKIFMLTMLNEKSAGKTTVSLDEYDPKTLKYQNKSTNIFDAGFIKYDAEIGKFNANWIFSFSPDTSKIAFAFYHKENVYISVVDKNFKQIWKTTVELDKDRLAAKVSSLRILNNGEVFLLFTESKGNNPHLGIIDYTLYCITEEGGTIKKKEILNDDPFHECVLFVTKDSKPYLTGMYKKMGLEKQEGFFFHEIDMQTAGFAKENKYKITSPLWPEKLSQKQRAKATNEDFKSIKVGDKYRHKIEIIEMNAGEFYFLIEQYKRNHAASPEDVDFSYDNVYVCYVNMNTNKYWDHLLAKAVRTNMTERLSYTSFERDGNLYLFYNDCIENLDKTKDTEIEEYFFVTKCTPKVVYAKYNKDGFIEKKQFETTGDEEVSRGFKMYSSDRKSVYLLLSGTDGKTRNWEYIKSILKISVE